MRVAATLFLLLCVPVRAETWTAADESRRIAQIKQDESRAFEMQMRGQSPFASSANSYYGNYYGPTQSRHYGYDPYVGPISQPQGPYRAEPGHKRQSTAQLDVQPASVDLKTTQSWCFTCMSPWNAVSANMQQAIRNLLDIRRAKYPGSALVVPDCSEPRNVSALKKEDCALSYCQTLTLTDHDTASSFTIRGCAEKFGAVDDETLRKRGDNTCKRLHNSVDIQECVCKHRKFCYAGRERSDLGYSEEAEATFLRPQAQLAGSARPTSLLAITVLGLLWLVPVF